MGPIVFGLGVLFLWSTGAASFEPDYARILSGVTPWVLITYSLTLIGGAVHVLGPQLGKHRALSFGMFGLAILVAIYAAFIAIWQHSVAFEPNADVYTVSGVLMCACICTSYRSHSIATR